MEFARKKIFLYVLIIATGIDFILPWPVFQQKPSSNLDESRFARQVVQPTWLNDQQEPTVDPTVYVNPRVLEETANIRHTIQEAVQEGTFAVTGEEPNFDLPKPNVPLELLSPSEPLPPLAPLPPSQPLPPLEPLRPPAAGNMEESRHGLPAWYLNMQRLFQSWHQGLLRGLGYQNN